jgi:hypothetical protein
VNRRVEAPRAAHLAAFAATALASFTAGPVFAAPWFQAVAQTTAQPIASEQGDAGAAATSSASFPADGRGANASAIAGAGVLKVSADAGIAAQPPAEPFVPLSVGGGGSATMRFDDVVFRSLANPKSAGFVEVALNVQIDGAFSLSQVAASDSTARAGLTLSYGLGVPGAGSSANPKTIGTLTRQIDRGLTSAGNAGVFSVLGADDGLSIDGLFTTPTFLVPLGTPLFLSLTLNANANAVTRDGAPVSAAAAFGDSLHWPAARPVFVLAEGYTARSAQAGIHGNVSAVPAPPGAWMFAAGLLAVAWRIGSQRRGA